ncbi:MAG TPA: hypothetical protein VHT75_08390, partial [Acidimicrobiales bacterium]|nr:hypothetical protein [Acidimicrobiales bacterium]
ERMLRIPRTLAAAALAGVLVAATACAHPAPTPAPGAPTSTEASAPDSGQSGDAKTVTATFGHDDAADNYDKALVPDGSKVFVAENVHDGLTTVVLDVRGLVPNHAYGAHAHAKPCGPKPEDAGAHYQHNADPVKPSVNHAFANPMNEIWLDFTTDAKGNATKASTVDWAFGATPAGVTVVHRLSGRCDVVLFFTTDRGAFARRLDGIGKVIAPAGAGWIAWPKKAARLATDMTEDVVREAALPRGLVDVKVCAIDEVWSGLKLVWRKELR